MKFLNGLWCLLRLTLLPPERAGELFSERRWSADEDLKDDPLLGDLRRMPEGGSFEEDSFLSQAPSTVKHFSLGSVKLLLPSCMS